MTKKNALRAKEMFRFLSVGRFYWRLLVLPLVGGILLYVSYLVTHDEKVLPLSFLTLFFIVYFITLGYIGSSARDRIIRIMTQIQLLPITKREKQFWLYLRSTWLPAVLLFLGAVITAYFSLSIRLEELLPFLPYATAVTLLLSILHWKGSYLVVDTENFVGVVSSREQTLLSFVTIMLSISPIIYHLMPLPLKVITTLLLLVIAIIYGKSDLHAFQIDGGSTESKGNPKNKKRRDFSFLKGMNSSLARYLYYLEWKDIKSPVLSYLVNLGTVLFVVLVYYTIGGLFAAQNNIAIFERGLKLSLFVSYFTFLMHHADFTNSVKETDLLLPLTHSTKSIASTINQIVRPTVYTFLNTAGVVLVIRVVHLALTQVIEQPQIQGSLLFYTFTYTLLTLALSITVFSLMDLLILVMTVAMQAFGYYKASRFVLQWSLFFYVFTFILVFSQEQLSRLETLISYPVLAIYPVIFLFSRISLHFVMKKVQVITA